MFSDKVKNLIWWGAMVVYSGFMFGFTAVDKIPLWWTSISVTAIGVIGLLINKPWQAPPHPPE
jgi:hypothetical protein